MPKNPKTFAEQEIQISDFTGTTEQGDTVKWTTQQTISRDRQLYKR